MSGQNRLPTGWRVAKVKEVALSIQYGYTESSSKEQIGPKFLRITDIQNNQVDWATVPYCSIPEEIKSKYLLQNGDLVFARTGATVGKSFLIKGKIPEAVFASYLIRLRFPPTVASRYIYNFFQSHLYWKQIVSGQVGIGQPNVNGTKLGQLSILLPPMEEQERIVAKIEELFSELDAGVESLKKAQVQLKTYRQSVLKHAFEGRLTNDNIKDGELPEGWNLVKLSDAIEKVEYGSAAKSKESGEIPVLRMGNIQNGRFDWNDLVFTSGKDEIKRYSLTRDDVLFNRTNSAELVGKTAIYKGEAPAIFAGYLIRIKPKVKILDPNYLTYFLKGLE